ncbi:MAG: hypothetical protein QXO35_00995 [Candidatus Micrarchaeia archaeon]
MNEKFKNKVRKSFLTAAGVLTISSAVTFANKVEAEPIVNKDYQKIESVQKIDNKIYKENIKIERSERAQINAENNIESSNINFLKIPIKDLSSFLTDGQREELYSILFDNKNHTDVKEILSLLQRNASFKDIEELMSEQEKEAFINLTKKIDKNQITEIENTYKNRIKYALIALSFLTFLSSAFILKSVIDAAIVSGGVGFYFIPQAAAVLGLETIGITLTIGAVTLGLITASVFQRTRKEFNKPEKTDNTTAS